MRAKTLLAAYCVVCLLAVVTLATVLAIGQVPRLDIAPTPPVLFTRSSPSDSGDPAIASGEKKLTDKEVRDAVQKWWNDKDQPLKIVKVDVKKQDTPAAYMIKIKDNEWESARIDPQLKPGISRTPIAVPVTYRTGTVNFDLLFIIDRGGVVDGPYKNYKHIR